MLQLLDIQRMRGVTSGQYFRRLLQGGKPETGNPNPSPFPVASLSSQLALIWLFFDLVVRWCDWRPFEVITSDPVDRDVIESCAHSTFSNDAHRRKRCDWREADDVTSLQGHSRTHVHHDVTIFYINYILFTFLSFSHPFFADFLSWVQFQQQKRLHPIPSENTVYITWFQSHVWRHRSKSAHGNCSIAFSYRSICVLHKIFNILCTFDRS